MNCRTVSGNEREIVTFGRHTRKDGMPAFDWPNSGFRLIFRGCAVILSFAPFENVRDFYVLVKVDNISQRFALSTGKEKIILEGLPNKKHVLEFIRITEGEERIVFTGAEIFGSTPAVYPPELNDTLKIEFLGDSLTAGYGNLAPPTEKLYYPFQQDSTRAFAYVCASLLGADGHYECVSGKGVHFNCHGVKDCQIPEFFKYASLETKEPWDFSLWTPDAVVINAGTNDYCGGIDDATFKKAALDFLKLVRKTYPKALIIWAYGMTQKAAFPALEECFCEFGDENAHLLRIRSMYEYRDETGGNGHPNVKCHRRVGKMLAKYIKRELHI